MAENPLEERVNELVKEIPDSSIIDENKLIEIQNMDYYELKKSLKAKNDFCIYIEDEDGNVILSKGSSRINGDGIYCVE